MKLILHGHRINIIVHSPETDLYRRACQLDSISLQKYFYERKEKLDLNVSSKQEYTLLSNDRFTRIEFREKKRKFRKLFFYSVLAQDTLFPLYRISKQTIQLQGLVIIESEVGHFGETDLKNEKFDIEKLEFLFTDFSGSEWKGITEIRYDNYPLTFKQAETVLRSRYVTIL
jgi:hypothetical protein